MWGVSPWTAIRRPGCKVLIARCHASRHYLPSKPAPQEGLAPSEQRFQQSLQDRNQSFEERRLDGSDGSGARGFCPRVDGWCRSTGSGMIALLSRLAQLDLVVDATALGSPQRQQVVART